jgi:2-dehydro-3-deoxy-D-arabinonate dehydratase
VQICRFVDPETKLPALGVLDGESGLHALSNGEGSFTDMDEWLPNPDPLKRIVEAAHIALGEPAVAGLDSVLLLPPLQSQEVWAAGVTYERSKVARMEESVSGGSFYDLVYSAERPEIFFKANPRRVVGPGAAIRIRKDSTWDVPEPELACVISASGQIVGYTIGNDVSSRSIEGENPLYLPQAKVYDECCALGPVITLAGDNGIPDPRDLTIRLVIRRSADVAFEGEISTARMKRNPVELAEYLFRDNSFPEGAILLTGTGIVPPDEFTLNPGDEVEISISKIGRLRNTVR